MLLVFSEPGCGACESLLPEVGQWQREFGDQLPTIVISRGTVEEHQRNAIELGLGNVLLAGRSRDGRGVSRRRHAERGDCEAAKKSAARWQPAPSRSASWSGVPFRIGTTSRAADQCWPTGRGPGRCVASPSHLHGCGGANELPA